MKRIIIVFVFCCTVISTYAQYGKKNLIGTYFVLGTDSYTFPGTEGGGRYNAKYYYSTGLDYSRMLSKRWDFCTGMKYTRSNMSVTPAPGIPGAPRDFNLKLATIPVQMKYHFGKFFYINGGLLFNIIAKSSDEVLAPPYRGPTHDVNLLLGCVLGVGFEYELSSGITFSLNPSVTWNGIENVNGGESFLKFLQKEGNIQYARYLQGGVSFGIGYKF
jgi:hypothetical protein